MSTSTDENTTPTLDTNARGASAARHHLNVIYVFAADQQQGPTPTMRVPRLMFTGEILASITPPFNSLEECRRVQDEFDKARTELTAGCDELSGQLYRISHVMRPAVQGVLQKLKLEKCIPAPRIGYRTKLGTTNDSLTGSAVSLALLDTVTTRPVGHRQYPITESEQGAVPRLLSNGPYATTKLPTVSIYCETISDGANPQRSGSTVFVPIPSLINDPTVLDRLFPAIADPAGDDPSVFAVPDRAVALLTTWKELTRATGFSVRLRKSTGRGSWRSTLDNIRISDRNRAYVSLCRYMDGTRELELYPLVQRATGQGWSTEATVSITIQPGADHFMLNEDEDYILPLSRLSTIFQDHPEVADQYREQSGVFRHFEGTSETEDQSAPQSRKRRRSPEAEFAIKSRKRKGDMAGTTFEHAREGMTTALPVLGTISKVI